MVESLRDASRSPAQVDKSPLSVPQRIRRTWIPTAFSWKSVALVAVLIAGMAWGLTLTVGAATARVSNSGSGAVIVHKGERAAAHPAETTPTLEPTVATTTTTTVATPPVTALPVATAAPAAAPAVVPAVAAAVPPAVAPVTSEPAIAALVAEVEASGIEPGSNWSWSIGDTATHCGAMTGAGTGCTYGSNGLEYSVFSGSPTLALVAHELANAETQNDAVPSLLNEVAAAAAGSSWSPTDAVASCLVAHFMGLQDQSAGSWQCSAALAATVAANIHDSI
jgi:hypothetical protein